MAFFIALFMNELGTNLYQLYMKLGTAKIMKSVSAELSLAFQMLGAEVACMIALTALMTLLICIVWAIISLIGFEEFKKRFGSISGTRLLYWFLNVITFFNLYYFLHNALFPSTRLKISPICIIGMGMINVDRSLSSDSLWLLVITVPCLLALVGTALYRSRKFRFTMMIMVVSLFVLFCSYSFLTAPGKIQHFTAKNNIILCGVDSYQMNRLKIGGAPENVSPNVNAFLEESFRFDNAWTPFARTYPSWISILTGRYPVHNGVRFNLVPDSRLNPTNHYLPILMKDAGYFTFHGTDETRFSIIRPLFGYQRMFHPHMGIEDFLIGNFFDFSMANFIRQFHLGNDLFPAIKNNRAVVGYNPTIWTRNLIKAMNNLPKDQPVFIAFHLCGNHWPFSSPAPYCYMDKDRVNSCIRMVDAQIGKILQFFKGSGLYDHSTVIMLSDHGDGWSGDYNDHFSTHGDNFDRIWSNKIILGIHRPGLEHGMSMELVRTVDLYPTVLEIAGIEVPEGIDGLSLLPIIEGKKMEPRTLFAESGFDKTTSTINTLIQNHAAWYTIDPKTRLIHIRQEGYNKLMSLKSYMMIRGDCRMIMTPYTKQFRVFPFDRSTGLDSEEAKEITSAEKLDMLTELIQHFNLDQATILHLAQKKEFIDDINPARIRTSFDFPSNQ